MTTAEINAWKVVTLLLSRNFLVDILWNNIYLTNVQNLGQEDLVYGLVLLLKESLTLLQICSTFTYFVPIEVIESGTSTILTSSILMENCDHVICPGLSVVLLYIPVHKV